MVHMALVRHGITAWNKEGRAQGQSDNPLDEEGLEQAAAVAGRLAGERWDALYASDLQRARQTAEAIVAKTGLTEIYYDSRLRELSGGKIEGLTMAERIERFGSDWRTQELGMEKKEQAIARGAAVLELIASRHPDGRIIVVSHGALIRHALMGILPGLNVDELLDNTSVTEIRKDAGGWSCERYNCCLHLKTDAADGRETRV